MPSVKYYDDVSGTWKYAAIGAVGPQGPQGPQGLQGSSGVVTQTEPPADTSLLWIDEDDIQNQPLDTAYPLFHETPYRWGVPGIRSTSTTWYYLWNADELRLYGFVVRGKPIRITNLLVEVRTPGTATTLRTGIWNCVEGAWTPTSLRHEFAAIPVESAGVKSQTDLAIELPIGFYLFGMVANGTVEMYETRTVDYTTSTFGSDGKMRHNAYLSGSVGSTHLYSDPFPSTPSLLTNYNAGGTGAPSANLAFKMLWELA